jgi:4-hydroxyproline epimerase
MAENDCMNFQRVHVIDSHTGGEPTRAVISGGPDLGNGTAAERLDCFARRHDDFRRAVVTEPRGSDVLVGALLFKSIDPTCSTGVLFFNNVGYLGMCGHGTIGVMASLSYLGLIEPGIHRIETPAGVVTAELMADGRVAVENVPSYRFASSIRVDVPGYGPFTGDVAWGGNWFFLMDDHPFRLERSELPELIRFTTAVREALAASGIAGVNGREIDHIELSALALRPDAESTNFVLCPGSAYDRSPCGTGTSAKLACLYADGKLAAGEIWRQESVIGSVFEASFRLEGDRLIPRILGMAYVNADSQLIFNPTDPFCMGIPG